MRSTTESTSKTSSSSIGSIPEIISPNLSKNPPAVSFNLSPQKPKPLLEEHIKADDNTCASKNNNLDKKNISPAVKQAWQEIVNWAENAPDDWYFEYHIDIGDCDDYFS